jgi:hypothetical protein
MKGIFVCVELYCVFKRLQVVEGSGFWVLGSGFANAEMETFGRGEMSGFSD